MRNSLYINALQNLLFCIPKAAVLHGKSVGFALQNSRFRNAKSKLSFFDGIIFTKSRLLLSFILYKPLKRINPELPLEIRDYVVCLE
ncbi:hypothetical protein CTM62_09340 [Prevotella intermedia]|uniref:Uncharacterized protein n=1 Tax=Prevotella intermedia TaxID=28131 RepID=A0A2D3L911_PREIN|nr:hypothetical protein CTM62_09340 [Prevotella intermedia]